MPKSVVAEWHSERNHWLRANDIDPDSDVHWQVNQLGSDLRSEYYNTFSERWHRQLDLCHGECLLRRPDLAKIVTDSFHHFDGTRYQLTDFVVMPNHVHLLVAFHDEDSMLLQCESWKRFTATKINRIVGRRGRFWQQDGFDHLVRSAEQLYYLRDYIRDNPSKAHLKANEYVHYSRSI